MIAAVVNENKVENLIVLDSTAAIPTLKSAFGYEMIIPVDDSVKIGDTYDSENEIFLREGVRVYPEVSDKERITALEAAQNDTDAALIELANMIAGGAENG